MTISIFFSVAPHNDRGFALQILSVGWTNYVIITTKSFSTTATVTLSPSCCTPELISFAPTLCLPGWVPHVPAAFHQSIACGAGTEEKEEIRLETEKMNHK
jgi:hypothetical protein